MTKFFITDLQKTRELDIILIWASFFFFFFPNSSRKEKCR